MKNETPVPIPNRACELLLVAALTLFAFLPAASSLAQGDLTPPGSPAPTMKTLQQIEPRIDLQATPAPAGVDTTNGAYHFIINQSGSYYLSANLGVTKTNGIQVNAENVTIDLNGFQISRSSGTGGNGLEISAIAHRATIGNGSIKGFARGIETVNATARACAFRTLSVSNCTAFGIRTGIGSIVESCRVQDNSGTAGISTGRGSYLTSCTATKNTAADAILAGAESTLTDCTAFENTSSGAAISVGPHSTLANCTASTNTANHGILTADGCLLTNCSAGQNSGPAASTSGFKTGFGCKISNCTARANSTSAGTNTPTTGMGFWVGDSSTIEGCTAYFNRGNGIKLESSSTARGNNCESNGFFGDGAGIHAVGGGNRIEGNNVISNPRGIDVDAAGNLIVKNSARNGANNYVFVAGNFHGPIVNAVVPAGSPTPPPVNGNSASTTIPTTDPWANISF